MRRWVLYKRDITSLCKTQSCLTALIWWKKTVLEQIKWVVYSIMSLHSYFTLYCCCIKGSVLHGNLLLLLLLDTYLSQQIRHLAAQTLIARLGAWKLRTKTAKRTQLHTWRRCKNTSKRQDYHGEITSRIWCAAEVRDVEIWWKTKENKNDGMEDLMMSSRARRSAWFQATPDKRSRESVMAYRKKAFHNFIPSIDMVKLMQHTAENPWWYE